MHAERPPYAITFTDAGSVYNYSSSRFFERGLTDRYTDATDRPVPCTPWLLSAWVTTSGIRA